MIGFGGAASVSTRPLYGRDDRKSGEGGPPTTQLVVVEATPDFTTKAVLTMALYAALGIPGLIANIVFWREAKAYARQTGHRPGGMGCLVVMLWLGFIPVVLGMFLVIRFLWGMRGY